VSYSRSMAFAPSIGHDPCAPSPVAASVSQMLPLSATATDGRADVPVISPMRHADGDDGNVSRPSRSVSPPLVSSSLLNTNPSGTAGVVSVSATARTTASIAATAPFMSVSPRP